jgi:hypothetical protein
VLRRPSDVGLEYENTFFPSLDGIPLEAWFIPADSNKLLIVNHPMTCNRYGFPGHLLPWSEPLSIQYVETTSDPIRDSRFAMNGLTAMVAGLIAVAVGNENAIAHPDEHVSSALSASLYGGPILFLLAQA